MKILLISPYLKIKGIGLRILSSCLKQEGHEVAIVYLSNRDHTIPYSDEILDQVGELAKDYDLIGISLMTNIFNSAVQLTTKIREVTDAPVVWGGVHVTIRPQECLEHADMACVGEGEESFLEVVQKMEKGEDYTDTLGFGFRKGDEIVVNPTRNLYKSLDDLPFPDYDFENHFILQKEKLVRMDEKLFIRVMNGRYSFMSSRGCPYSCTYCSYKTIRGMFPDDKVLRKRTIDNVIEELVTIRDRFPFIKEFSSHDDAFFSLSKREITEFCEKYSSILAMPLSVSGANPLSMKRDKMEMLVNAGMKEIRMGIQSGSEETNKLYERGHTNEKVYNAVSIINEFKDKIQVPRFDIILNNPYENEEQVIESLTFLATLPAPFRLSLYSLVLYPGTALYEKAKLDGFVGDEQEEIYNKIYKYSGSDEKSYLNDLFILISDFAATGVTLGAGIMSLLTNPKLRKYGISGVLYKTLKGVLAFTTKYVHAKHLLGAAISDIRSGEWGRIRAKLRIA